MSSIRPASLVLFLASACLADSEDSIDSLDQEIIGGSFDPTDPAVVLYSGFCTGTLISPRIVLTAAHCVEGGGSRSVSFGNGEDPWIDSIDIVDTAMHRLYDPPAFLQWDIALARLGEDAPAGIQPIPFNTAPLGAGDIGLGMRSIGFGVNDGMAQTGFGTKRQVPMSLDEISYFHIGVGDASHNICQGDSGGPTLAVIDGEERVVGVHSFGSDFCRDRSYLTRVDSMQDWLVQVIGAWDGPCALDGTCVEDGCTVIDPDCDICGFDGFCGQDCENVDLDCPLGGRAGDLCGDRYDCETRNCREAPDDPRVSFCTTTCDPARPLETCPVPLSICADGPDGPTCMYAGPSKSTQGWSCDEGGDCRSGMCDSRHDICVEPCSDDSECGEPYSCEEVGGVSACTVPSEEGGCGCGAGEGAPGPAGLLVFFFGIAVLRRRRA